jgi:hypothetical protein
VVLVVPVDREQVPVVPQPGDEPARGGGHLVVPVGQAAGQRLDRARLPGQARHLVEERREIARKAGQFVH